MKPHSDTPSQVDEGHTFPTNMLPERLQAMVIAVAQVFHVPDVMPAVIALTMISAALGKGLRISSGRGRKTMSNLFSLVSADSGTGKSSVLGLLRKLLDILQTHFQKFGRQKGLDRLGSIKSKERGGFDGNEGFDGGIRVVPPRPKKSSKIPDPRLICSELTGAGLGTAARAERRNHPQRHRGGRQSPR